MRKLLIYLIIFITLISFLVGGARALKLPEQDVDGEKLFVRPTVIKIFNQLHIIIYILIGVLLVSVVANIIFAITFIRFQYVITKVTDAVDRVDLLSKAMEETSKAWAAKSIPDDELNLESSIGKEESQKQINIGSPKSLDNENIVDMFIKGVDSQFGDQ